MNRMVQIRRVLVSVCENPRRSSGCDSARVNNTKVLKVHTPPSISAELCSIPSLFLFLSSSIRLSIHLSNSPPIPDVNPSFPADGNPVGNCANGNRKCCCNANGEEGTYPCGGYLVVTTLRPPGVRISTIRVNWGTGTGMTMRRMRYRPIISTCPGASWLPSAGYRLLRCAAALNCFQEADIYGRPLHSWPLPLSRVASRLTLSALNPTARQIGRYLRAIISAVALRAVRSELIARNSGLLRIHSRSSRSRLLGVS